MAMVGNRSSMQITHQTTISIALLLTLLSGIFYIGMKMQKIDDMDKRLTRIEDKFDKLVANKSLTLGEKNAVSQMQERETNSN